MRKILLVLLTILLVTSPLCAGGNRWGSKPPLGSQINWGHPLSRGLVGCWLLNENGGSSVKDIVNQTKLIFASSNIYWSVLKNALLKSNGANSQAYITTPSLYKNNEITIIWDGVVFGNGAISNDPYFFGVSYDNADVTPYTSYVISRRNLLPKQISFCFNNGSYQEIAINNVITYGEPINCALTISKDSVIAKAYINGVYKAQSVNVGTIAYTSTSKIMIGGHNNLTTLDIASVSRFGYIYNRALSPQEIQSLYQDPYQFIKSPTVWSKFSTAIAATGNFFMMFD